MDINQVIADLQASAVVAFFLCGMAITYAVCLILGGFK